MNDETAEIRAAIKYGFDWRPINNAIEDLAHGVGIDREAAWSAIKDAIGLGTVQAEWRDDRGEYIALEPHWIGFLAQFQLPGEPRVADLPIGALPNFLRHTDFPKAGTLWFDRRRAAENRLARNIGADNRAERSLPPTRVCDVVLSRATIERLSAALALRQEKQRPGVGPAAFNRGSQAAMLPASTASAAPRKPGPRPQVGPRVWAAMRADLTRGKITRDDLREMKQIAMEREYQASADTCRKARNAVLSELGGIPQAPNSAE